MSVPWSTRTAPPIRVHKDRSTRLVCLFPLALALLGAKWIAGAAATVVAAACVFAPVVASAADASALEVVVLIHWPAFAASADGPAPVSSVASDVP